MPKRLRRSLAIAPLTVAVALVPAAAQAKPSKGELIAFVASSSEGYIGVTTVEPDNPGSLNVIDADPDGNTGSPEWAPDGELLAVVHSLQETHNQRATIQLLDRKGKVKQTLLGEKDQRVGTIGWSPDGSQIAYECASTAKIYFQAELCIVDVATGAHRMLTDPSDAISTLEYPQRISWSGDKIAWGTYDNVTCPPGPNPFNTRDIPCGGTEVAFVNATTGAATVLEKDASWPAFSPDGKKLVYENQSGVVTADASGGGPRTVVPRSDLALGNHYATPSPIFSPDSKSILFQSGSFGANNGNEDLFEIAASGSGKPVNYTDTPNYDNHQTWAQAAPACTIEGTPKADHLVGTKAGDVICGFGGNDTIDGKGGDG